METSFPTLVRMGKSRPVQPICGYRFFCRHLLSQFGEQEGPHDIGKLWDALQRRLASSPKVDDATAGGFVECMKRRTLWRQAVARTPQRTSHFGNPRVEMAGPVAKVVT